MRRFQALARLVVVQHGVGQEGIELPALDQPGARFRVRDLQGALFDGAQVLVVARREVERVFLGRRREQREAADVVQQAGEIRLFRLRILDAARDFARQHGGRQRILPERAQVGGAGIREAVEGLEDGVADDQRLDHVRAQRHHRLLEVRLAAVAVVRGAAGDGEDLARHAGILGNQRGQFGHAQIVRLQVRKQLDEDLGHGRQARDQQAIADVLVWLMYGFKHGRQLGFG